MPLSTMEEREDLYHHYLSGNKALKVKVGNEMVDGEILDILIYHGTMLARIKDTLVEIELSSSETIH